MKIDIRTKMLIAAIISTLALIYNDIVVLAALFIISIIILFFFKIPPYIFKKLRGMITLYLGLIIMQSIFIHSGKPLISIGEFYLLTTDGLVYGGIVVLRFMIFLASGVLLLRNTTTELLTALAKFRMSDDLIIMIMVSIRFLPVITEEIQSTLNFIQLRGVNLKKVYKKKIFKVYVNIFYPIIYSVWVKAQKISMLMELRGFRRYDSRVYYREIKLCNTDYIIIAFTVFSTVLFICFANYIKNYYW